MAQLIHYIDQGEFYTVYGIATLIVVLMLLWYFVRTNIEVTKPRCEYLTGSYSTGFHTETSQPDKSTEGMFSLEDPALLAHFPEFAEDLPTPVQLNNTQYPLKRGLYGDVPVDIYDLADTSTGSEWADMHQNIYVPNMRTSFRAVSTPVEATFW